METSLPFLKALTSGEDNKESLSMVNFALISCAIPIMIFATIITIKVRFLTPLKSSITVISHIKTKKQIKLKKVKIFPTKILK